MVKTTSSPSRAGGDPTMSETLIIVIELLSWSLQLVPVNAVTGALGCESRRYGFGISRPSRSEGHFV